MDIDMLQRRAAIIRQVRSFFESLNYLELDTPLLSPNLIPESCLEVFRTERIFPHGSKKEKQPLWLIPSPEIYMKKIIGQHCVNVFQICKCFRNGESCGHLHNSEFTMLEYYTIDADYMDSLTLTEELINFLTTEGTENKDREKYIPFEHITVAEAFSRYAGFDLFKTAAEGTEAMETQAKKLGLEPMPGLTVTQLYDLIFIHSVEPQLKTKKPIALIDYPAFVPCLAKKANDGLTAERWELYYDGIELANCYSEETDILKIKEFFINEEAEKNRTAKVIHNIEHNYWKLPRCSGTAMGLDRLIMMLTGKKSIDGVLPFGTLPL
ncbi:MAG: LysR family transcriptional regulator [Treponema sp.]|nr:LysR family transcriptional regulator [Treponema sp.]